MADRDERHPESMPANGAASQRLSSPLLTDLAIREELEANYAATLRKTIARHVYTH